MRVAGVLVGKVARIRLVNGKAIVDLELDQRRGPAPGRLGRHRDARNARRQLRRAAPGSAGRAQIPDGTPLQGKEGVSLDQVSRLARDIEIDLSDVTAEPEQVARRPARRTADRDDRGQHGRAFQLAAHADRYEPRQDRRHDQQLPRVLLPDDPAGRPHRPARRRQPGQRHGHRGQCKGALDEAADHGRQHERDHPEDPLRTGQRRPARRRTTRPRRT